MCSSVGRMALTTMFGLTASTTAASSPTLLQHINGYAEALSM
jgi:hypothetical protein